MQPPKQHLRLFYETQRPEYAAKNRIKDQTKILN